jgi:hypothetical protein
LSWKRKARTAVAAVRVKVLLRSRATWGTTDSTARSTAGA